MDGVRRFREADGGGEPPPYGTATAVHPSQHTRPRLRTCRAGARPRRALANLPGSPVPRHPALAVYLWGGALLFFLT